MSSTNNNPIVLTTFYKQFSFQVKVNNYIFKQGETIHIEAVIENKGQEAFVYYGSGNCDDTIYFSIQTKEGYNYLIGKGSILPRGCHEDYREFQLNPNQKINKSADFETIKIIDESGHESPLKTGEYILTAKYGEILSTILIQIQ